MSCTFSLQYSSSCSVSFQIRMEPCNLFPSKLLVETSIYMHNITEDLKAAIKDAESGGEPEMTDEVLNL